MDEEEGPTDVGLEEPVEVGDGDTRYVLVEEVSAGVVDDYVDGVNVEGFERQGDEVGAEGWALLVSGDGDGFDAEGFNAFDGFRGCSGAFAVVYYDLEVIVLTMF